MAEIPGSTVVKAEVPAQEVKISQQPSAVPTTTYQEDLTTAGQRKVNLIWEYTQAAIALMVVLATMAVGIWAGMHPESDGTIPNILATAFGMITGFYFARTNHSAIGGIGKKPVQQYEGR